LITKVRTAYTARVIDSPAGDGKTAVRLPALRSKDTSPHGARGSRHLRAEESSPREDGTELFRAIFKGEVRERWLQSLEKVGKGRGLRLKLRLEGVPELVGLPWECLFDPDQNTFLALRVETPVVRYLEVAAEPLLPEPPIPSKLLVVTANPQGTEQLNIEPEIGKIRQALSPLGSRVRIERLDRPSLADLERRIRECHVLHFIGHASSGALLLESRNGQPRAVDVYDLTGMLAKHHSLRLVVLNTCQGARHSESDAFSGVAQGLVQKGVPAVIAMRHDISDEAAILFAEELYRSLAQGDSVQEAVALGRKAIFSEHGEAWSVPALYMRQDLSPFPRRRPVWWTVAAAIAVLVVLAGLAAYGIPRLIDSYECPSPPGLGMRFVKIPAGSFQMGSDQGPVLEKPPHPVRLSKPFCLGVFEVTQSQWDKVMPSNPSTKKGEDLPVANVTGKEVREFLRKFNERDPTGNYDLATEAQWEYAASGGGQSIFGYGDEEADLSKYGNCNAGGKPTRVGTYQPTRWGVYDLHGNVSEWVTGITGYTKEAVVDPGDSSRSDALGIRGGSFLDEPFDCRAAHRDLTDPSTRRPEFGFRVVRDPLH
jgi:formylglycine-generating enzyme required for sulfatase activity